MLTILKLLTVIQLVWASQVPLQVLPSPPAPWRTAERWRFDLEPFPNATDNYVFETTASLLQQWPNTRYRNGHAIVPATIPVGTLLYHSRSNHEIPSEPEWVATDPEHSFLFCVGKKEGDGCWCLTLAVTRPLTLLYFDGSSAAKMDGPMDTQDLLVWGKVEPEHAPNEPKRIKDLCQWGKKYNIDGFIRMELDFEIMLCDFTQGVDLTSFVNLDPYIVFDRDHSNPTQGLEKVVLSLHQAVHSGQQHDRFPGETRIKLDLTRLVSFYDTDLFPSLIEHRHGKERWDHRVEKLGKEDLETLAHKMDEVIGRTPHDRSGVDWTSLVRVVVHRYADRLEVIQYMLNQAQSPGFSKRDVSKALGNVHKYTTSVLSPFLINGVKPGNSTTLAWAAPVFEQCATTYSKIIPALLRSSLTHSERLILKAVEGVTHEICRVVVGMWADGVTLGLDDRFAVSGAKRSPRDASVDWNIRIDKLVHWLDWSAWVKCKPACGFEEKCYLPTWPFLHDGKWPRAPPTKPKALRKRWDSMWGWGPDLGSGLEGEDYWLRPQPECIRRVMPLDML